ncbi:hypothetical protein GCM10025865_15880 [Paraoerskovia sediminicola]|uniref:Gram-positive cocci surface proteins LPxTG domain-containing protein n=1 Tax=Paraoerskovia sediminicola TaxID=1138587 RepID=A0ABN6XBQ6_9CELL|nr:LPXTG cell wall anchor domain-containing protein [Paraoerskovia sediminicola]BDZ42289.1 hypothetical protein GCM10025865_15880 [Paraoerskovia sediminicola]
MIQQSSVETPWWIRVGGGSNILEGTMPADGVRTYHALTSPVGGAKIYWEGGSKGTFSTNENECTAAAPADTTAPTVTVKDSSDGADGRYRSVSFKLYDAGKIDKVEINGVEKNLTDATWSDVNGVKPGALGAVEGKNALVAYDVAGNTTTVDFVLDTTGPKVTVKDESVGSDPVFSTVSYKLHDGSKVDKVVLNGTEKDLTDNEWSDLNGVKPGTFGAVEGANTLVAYDALGNETTVEFTLDTVAPKVTVKDGASFTNGADGRYSLVSFKLNDAGKIDKAELNGKVKDLGNNVWSDLNFVKPGTFGAVEGKNTLVVLDVAGNRTTVEFVLDTTGPEVTVKNGASYTVGSDDIYSLVSYKLHDGSKVDKVVLNGTEKDLTDNVWSDVNYVKPGTFGAVEGDNTLVAYDALGNATEVEFVLDVTLPVISVPAGDQYVGAGERTFDLSQVELHPDWVYVEFNQIGDDGKWKKTSGQRFEGVNEFSFTVNGADLVEGVRSQVKITSVDLAGNRTSTTFPVIVDTTGPEVTVKDGESFTVGADGVYSLVSFKLHDNTMIDKVVLNGVEKDLSNNAWSDVNYVKPGTFGAVEGDNTLVAHDVAGNTTTVDFVLHTAPAIAEDPASTVTAAQPTCDASGTLSYVITAGVDPISTDVRLKELGDGTGGDQETYYLADGTTVSGDNFKTAVYQHVELAAGESITITSPELGAGWYKLTVDGNRAFKNLLNKDFTLDEATGCDVPDGDSVLTLDGSSVTTKAVDGLPWIVFDVTLTDPGARSASQTVYLEITDGTNTEKIELGDLVDGHLSGEILWPGASASPSAWPGWTQDSDGVWVKTDEGFAWTLGDISAKLMVNPELAVDLAYPADAQPPVSGAAPAAPSDDTVADENDAAGSSDVVVTGAETVSNTVTATDTSADAADGETVVVTSAALPQTGSDSALLAIGAAFLVALGSGLLWARRRA